MATTDERHPLVQEVTGRLSEALRHYRRQILDVELTLAFLSGHQWVTADAVMGLHPVPNRARERRVTDNRMLPVLEWRQAMLHKERPVATSFAGGRDLADEEAAHVAAKLADYWNESCGLGEAERRASTWTDIAGMSFVAPVWRQSPHARVKTKRFRALTEPKRIERNGLTLLAFREEVEVTVPASDLGFDVYHPLQTFCFPLCAQGWQQVTGALTVDLVSRDYLETWLRQELAAESLKPVTREELNFQALEHASQLIDPEFGFGLAAAEGEPRYLLLVWRERPTQRRPQGRYAVIAGERVFHDGDLPYVAEAREIDPNDEQNLTLGLVPYPASDVLPRLLPMAPMALLRRAQKTVNRLLTDEAENRRNVGRNVTWVAKDSVERDTITNEHGLILEYDSKGGRVKPPLLTQGMPLAGIAQEIERAGDRFNDVAGRPTVMWGRNDSNIRSALQLDYLREEAGVPIEGRARQREIMLTKVVRLGLAIGRRRYGEGRLAQIYGEDHSYMVQALLQANLRTDVRLKEGSLVPRNHALQDAKMVEFLQFGAFLDRDGKPNMDLFWEMVTLGSLNRDLDARQQARNKQRREIGQMVRGVPTMVEPWDDHATELETLQAFLRRREFAQLPEKVRALLIVHLEWHRKHEELALAPELVGTTRPEAEAAPDEGQVALPPATMQVA